MRCPVCASPSTKVLDSRESHEGTVIRRRRGCMTCGHRFTTRERVEEQLTTVVKRSGEKQPFDRNKILRGLKLACRKRPIRPEQLENMVVRIEQWAATRGDRELNSTEIGARIAHHLHELDEVAYVRFVSVYRSFDTIQEFEHLLHEMEKAEQVDPEGQRRLFEPAEMDKPSKDHGAS